MNIVFPRDTIPPDFDGRQACADVTVEVFYSPTADDIRVAKRICAHCPVLDACRAYALTHERWGTWGGLTEDDRKRLRRHHGRQEVA